MCVHIVFILLCFISHRKKTSEKFNVEWFVELIILYGVCVCLYRERGRLYFNIEIFKKYLLSTYNMPGIIFQLRKLRLSVYKFTLFEISKTKTRIKLICFSVKKVSILWMKNYFINILMSITTQEILPSPSNHIQIRITRG